MKFSEPLSEPAPESKLRMDLGNRVRNTPANGREGSGNTSTTPWYEAYRDTFLDHLKQSDHETIKHYVSGEFAAINVQWWVEKKLGSLVSVTFIFICKCLPLTHVNKHSQ